MSELGNKVRLLRGKDSYDTFARKAGLSMRVVHKIENGEHIRLETISRMAQALRLNEQARLDLVASWLKTQLGPDAGKVRIEPKEPLELRDKPSLPLQIQTAVTHLTTKQQEQILLACERPEVLAGIEHLNKLYSSLKRKS